MKELVSGLEIPRETLRRKLDSLINKGVILKIKGGYIFPPQIGSADISSEFRKIIEISLQKLTNKLNLIHVIKY
jgi:DeoR/GlpR family transcriptional regulator of sugar metabolism